MSAASRNVKRFAKRWTGADTDSTVVSNYRGSVLYIGALREVLAERRDYRRAAQQKEALRWAESTRADKAEAMLKEVDAELARVKEQKATDDAVRLPSLEEEQAAEAVTELQTFLDGGGLVTFISKAGQVHPVGLGDRVQQLMTAARMLPVRTEERHRAFAQATRVGKELTNANIRTAEAYQEQTEILKLLPEDYRAPEATVLENVTEYIEAQDARLTEQDKQLAEQATSLDREQREHAETRDRTWRTAANYSREVQDYRDILKEITGLIPEGYRQPGVTTLADLAAYHKVLHDRVLAARASLTEANRILREVGIQVPEQFKTSGVAVHIWVGELAASWNATQKLLRNTSAQIPERFKNGNGADLPDWTRRLKEAWQTAARQPHPDQLAADLQQGVNAVNNLLEAVREVVRKNG